MSFHTLEDKGNNPTILIDNERNTYAIFSKLRITMDRIEREILSGQCQEYNGQELFVWTFINNFKEKNVTNISNVIVEKCRYYV